MIKAERQTSTKLNAKGLCIYEGNVVDEGEVVDLIELITSVFGDAPFDISVSRSVKEEVDTEPDEEIDISEIEA